MKNFNSKTGELIKTPEKQIEFMKEIEAICRKYDLSISHEDGHGAFEIDKFSEDNIEWLKHAHINWL